MKKLSVKEQCKRIQQILKCGQFITCPDCKEVYLPMSDEAEEICPLCRVELYDPELMDYDEDRYHEY